MSKEGGTMDVTAVTGILQLLVLTAAVGGIFFTFGSKEEILNDAIEEISDLKSISSDLVKAQVLSQAKDGEHGRMLEDILRRLAKLEDSR
ncbi:MAG: hypothetical protein CMH52_14370 [Myxococcales bacterium]|nr:hypothetical protein [Myxococcales bacterium]|tara:strand:- start:689 stop:958 length:270 start_codon:yes stop_codon:yes gene_type:complete